MALLDVRDNGYVGVYSTWWIYDPYKTFVNKVYYVDWANGTYSEYLSTSDKICLGDDYFIKNNEFYFYTDKTTAIATLNNYTYDANYGYSLGYYDNLISFVPSSNKIYVYKRVNTATFNLVSTEDYVSDSRYYVASRNLVVPKLTYTGLYYETSKNGGVEVKALIHDDADSSMLKLVTPNTTLYSTFDADAAASNVLLNKVFYNNTGKVTGTMPNNGALTITPSEQSQSFNAGYYSARNHRDGAVSNKTSTSFTYQRASSSHWHGAECDITGLIPGKTYKMKFKSSGANSALTLALSGTTITSYTFDTTPSQEVGVFTSTELEATFTPTGTTVTALIIQHGGTPYYSFTFSGWEIERVYALKTNLEEIREELNYDLDIANAIMDHLSPYIELEYIQSSGTQYINIGIIFNNNTKITGHFSYVSSTSSESWVLGCGRSGAADAYVGIWKPVNQSVINAVCNLSNTSGITYDTNEHEIEIAGTNAGNVIRIDSTSKTASSISNARNIGLFHINDNDTGGSHYSSARIYDLKMYQSGELVRDLIPCKRRIDNVIGLYDTINKQFKINEGTGSFTKGSNVN